MLKVIAAIWFAIFLVFFFSIDYAKSDSHEASMETWVMPEGGITVVWHIEPLKQIKARWDIFVSQMDAPPPSTPEGSYLAGFQINLGGVCHIWTPALNEPRSANTIRHEVRHCIEGAWHD
jgi:hypothetical protein